MSQVHIITIPGQFAEAQALLDGRQYVRAMQAAISRTLTTGRARVARKLHQEINLPVTAIKELITVSRPHYRKLSGTITVNRKPSPLKVFNPRKVAAGVKVKTRRNRPAELLRGAFIPNGFGGGHVFERQLTAGPGSRRVPRLPIEKRYGPTLVGILAGAPGVANEVAAGLGETLNKNINSQINRFLARPRRAISAAA